MLKLVRVHVVDIFAGWRTEQVTRQEPSSATCMYSSVDVVMFAEFPSMRACYLRVHLHAVVEPFTQPQGHSHEIRWGARLRN